MSLNNELLDIVKSVKAMIELEIDSGVGERLKSSVVEDLPAEETKAAALESLEMEALSCKRCGLSKGRNNVVFGTGNPEAKLMFIGEGPGHDEDLQGLPFVGRAGGLLTKIIEAMGLKRKDVYIANIVKCRPPGNRNPLPTEMLACEEYLVKQIDIIKPRIICALGKTAAQALLKTPTPISRLRGNFAEYHGIKVMPTYHPAYLLRNPGEKAVVWKDVQLIMRELK